jgi:hypothetical protein
MEEVLRPLDEPEILISYLLSAANENSAAIADSLEKVLTERINLGTEDLIITPKLTREGQKRKLGGGKRAQQAV